MDHEPHFADAFPPAEIARKGGRLGVTKAQTDTITHPEAGALLALRLCGSGVKQG